MSEVGNTIKSLIFGKDQAGPDMTHGLKVLGDGDMQNGIKRVAAFFWEEGTQNGYRRGERSGVIKGSAGTFVIGSLVVGGIYVIDKYKEHKAKKAHEEEGRKILSALQQKVPENMKQEVQEEQQIIVG